MKKELFLTEFILFSPIIPMVLKVVYQLTDFYDLNPKNKKKQYL